MQSANPHFKPDERRDRKLLLHEKEIIKLENKVALDGLSIVALSIYFNAKNYAKVQIALARGKKLHDKRETLKQKDAQREAKSAMKNFLYK
jgi:SsrA-binding protein